MLYMISFQYLENNNYHEVYRDNVYNSAQGVTLFLNGSSIDTLNRCRIRVMDPNYPEEGFVDVSGTEWINKDIAYYRARDFKKLNFERHYAMH